MAVTLAQLGDAMLTSIYGRRLALDGNNALTGVAGYRGPVEDVTTTAGSSLAPYGTSNLAPVMAASSGVVPYTLQALPVGSLKHLALTSTTTGGVTITVASGHYIGSTGASSGTTITFWSRGGVTLQQLSTVRIGILAPTLGSTTTMTSS